MARAGDDAGGLPLMLNGFMQIKERVPPSPEKVTIPRHLPQPASKQSRCFIVLLSFFFLRVP